MASPFARPSPPSTTRLIRPGSQLRDYASERPDHKILPQRGEENILITSALPYVNNQPHLGNIIGSTLSADVFARYSRCRNKRVLYICGTDEYGTTTEVMAAKENVGPQELCDKYHKLHAEAYEWFQIGFDHFGRTTTEKQTEICQEIFLKLYQNGWLEEQNKEQLYCEKDERFLADRYVEGTCPICKATGARGDQCETCSQTYDPLELIDPICSSCGASPVARFSAHLFIKLAEIQPLVEAWVKEASARGVWSNNGMAFTNGWLKGGLQSRSMTRDLKWGVKLPKELGEKWENKVMYVWFDAPIGYPSITANYTDEWRQWWQNPEDVTLHQFMGKDNVPFHTILFPAYLIGTQQPWTMLHSISTTEYLQYEGTKFSKSKNVGVFGQNARETGVPASVWRYYLLANRPETNDSEFTWSDFVAKSNTELLNNLGNFVNRMIKFVNVKYDSIIPSSSSATSHDTSLPHVFSTTDESFVKDVDVLVAQYIDQMDNQKIRAALITTMTLSSRGNLFIQENRLDNALLLSDPSRCAEVVLLTLNLIYTLSALVHPFMPSTSDEMLAQLDATPRTIPEKFSIDLLPGHRIGTASHLFARIDPAMVALWKDKYGGDAPKGVVVEEPLSKKAQMKAKKAQLAVAKALDDATPKSAEQLALVEQIRAQGERVKMIKGGKGEGLVEAEEVKRLLELKQELVTLTAALAAL